MPGILSPAEVVL
jgi:hypothetical protein